MKDETMDIPLEITKTFIHNKSFYSIEEIMLEVQKLKEFPALIETENSTIKIKNEQQATFFSLGMVTMLEGLARENLWEQNE